MIHQQWGNRMKPITALFTILTVILLMVLSPPTTLPQEKPATCNWEVYFSPHGGCTEAIIRELNKAKSTILVQAHSAKIHLPIQKLRDLSKKNFQINIWKTFNLKTGGA